MTRQDQIEQARRALREAWDLSDAGAVDGGLLDDLDAALALPADPVSVDERERALARAGVADGYVERQRDEGDMDEHERAIREQAASVGTSDAQCDRIIAAVNATHPRAPRVEAADVPWHLCTVLVPEEGVPQDKWIRVGGLTVASFLARIESLEASRKTEAESREAEVASAYERGREDAARVCDAYWNERNSAAVGVENAIADEHMKSIGADDCAARIRAHSPVAQVAPSEADEECPRCGGDAGPHLCGDVHYRERFAPSAPRDQGGGLREWFSRVLRNAAERGLIVSQDETGIDAALAEVAPPPTDGVAAAYERAAETVRDVIAAHAHHGDTRYLVEAMHRIRALAAPVSEKERAK